MASTPNGKWAMIKVKWLSLDNHMHNVYRGHSENFLKVPAWKASKMKKKQKMIEETYALLKQLLSIAGQHNSFSANTKPTEKLSSVLMNVTMCKYIVRLCSPYETLPLKSYTVWFDHSAPQSIAISMKGWNAGTWSTCVLLNTFVHNCFRMKYVFCQNTAGCIILQQKCHFATLRIKVLFQNCRTTNWQ